MSLTVDTPGPIRPPRVIDLSPNVILAAVVIASILYLKVPLDSLAVLMFLGAGFVLLFRSPTTGLQILVKHWFILMIPGFCLLSTLWSDYPPQTLRFSIQLLLTFMIAIAVGRLISPRSAVKIMYFVMLVAVLDNIANGVVRSDGAWMGIYSSKNHFATEMALFTLLSTALALDPTINRPLRMLALACVPVGLILVVLGQAFGALLVTPPALLTVATGLLLRRFGGWQKVAFLVVVTLLFLASIVLFVFYWEQMFGNLLIYSGKDSTLTGRTDIWAIGLQVISERPFFGVGFGAFWVEGNPIPEAIWEEFGILTKSGFTFHNLYITNAVEIGIVGVAFQVVAIFMGFFLLLRWVIIRPRAENCFFLGYMVTMIMLSPVESPLFFQFLSPSLVTIIAIVYGVRSWESIGREPTSAPTRSSGGATPSES